MDQCIVNRKEPNLPDYFWKRSANIIPLAGPSRDPACVPIRPVHVWRHRVQLEVARIRLMCYTLHGEKDANGVRNHSMSRNFYELMDSLEIELMGYAYGQPLTGGCQRVVSDYKPECVRKRRVRLQDPYLPDDATLLEYARVISDPNSRVFQRFPDRQRRFFLPSGGGESGGAGPCPSAALVDLCSEAPKVPAPKRLRSRARLPVCNRQFAWPPGMSVWIPHLLFLVVFDS